MRKSTCFLLAALIAVLFTGCAGVTAVAARGGGLIRVLVLKDLRTVSVRGAAGQGTVTLKRAAPGMMSVNGELKHEPVRLRPSGELIYVNDRPYRGRIDVYSSSGGLMVVNELSMETYLVGIINHEISSRWHLDSVKAQAVISRTYALYQINEAKKKADPDAPYDIEGSVLGQVYKGTGAEDKLAAKAVRSTRGEVITYNGELALTVFHSNAGGRTEASRDVWRGDYPYLVSVKSPYDSESPGYDWEFSVIAGDLGRLLKAAGVDIGRPVYLKVRQRTRAGRVTRLVVKDSDGRAAELTGEDVRRAVGYGAVKSTIFKVGSSGGSFVFKGRGSGHGVGLSQWGAKGMAEHGYTYKEILSHYYPGTRLKRAY